MNYGGYGGTSPAERAARQYEWERSIEQKEAEKGLHKIPAPSGKQLIGFFFGVLVSACMAAGALYGFVRLVESSLKTAFGW
jgi:hypothetical protein